MSGIGMDGKAMAAVKKEELTRFKTKMDGLKKSLDGSGESREAKLREACKDFEAVFIGKLWKEMRSSVKKEGYLHSKQEDQYISMFDRDFSEKMADSGGIGLADMLYDQLSSKLKQASRDALTGKAEIRPLTEEHQGIPLKRNTVHPLKEDQNMTLDDWIGEEAAVSPTGAVSAHDDVTQVSELKAAGAGAAEASQVVETDMDVKARLEALARRLEREADSNVGRKFASLK